VPDSPDLLLKYAHYVTQKKGGRGAVREVCELIMQAQDTFDGQMAQFLTQASIAN